MKKAFPELLQTFLWALLPGLSCLSLLCWYAGVPVGLIWAIPLLILWAALLTGADRVLPQWGGLILCIPAALGVIALSDRAALAQALSSVSRAWTIMPSASVNALLLLVSAVVGALAIPALRRFPLRCALSLCAAAAWVFSAFRSLELPRLAPCALVPILLYTAAEAVTRICAHEDADPPRMLLPLFTAAAIVLLFAPSAQTPYPYPILRSVLNRIETAYLNLETDLFYRQEGDAEYSLSFNGLSDAGDEEAEPEEDPERVFYLSAVPHTYGIFYLAGSTFDRYDGHEWSSTVDRGMIDFLGWEMDTAERVYALWRWNRSAEKPCYPNEDQLLFRYNKMNTRTIFTCLNTYFIGTNVSRFPYTSRPSRVLFNYVQERDAWFRLFVIRPDTLRWEELAKASEGYEYDGDNRLHWNTVLSGFNDAYGLSLERDERVESQLAQRESYIRSSYLTLPDDVSDRVIALARTITADCTDDLSRLDAIADYLQANYSYTLTPDPAPEDVTFLDYLLFDAQEGYCTWFATAAAILARAAGVPTRYVHGYRAVLNPGETVLLNTEPGHAWCEGYISGFGWVVVEATPGYTADAEEIFGKDYRGVGGSEAVYPGGTPETPDEPEPEEDAPEAPEKRGAPWLPLALAALPAAAAAVVLLRRRHARLRYDRASLSGRVRLDLQRLSVYLARRGYPKEKTESLREWLSRVRWHYLLIDADEAMRYAKLYEEVLFGGKQPTLDEWAEEKVFVDALRPRRSWPR